MRRRRSAGIDPRIIGADGAVEARRKSRARTFEHPLRTKVLNEPCAERECGRLEALPGKRHEIGAWRRQRVTGQIGGVSRFASFPAKLRMDFACWLGAP